jgi:Zn-dependent protease with chaperone function
MERTSLGTCLVIAVTLAAPAFAGQQVKLDGYVEKREGGELTIDGQRVRLGSRVKQKGRGPGFAAIPLGYEAKVKGVRQPDGTVLAQELETRPNGQGLFEDDLRASFDALEDRFRRSGRMFEEGEYGFRRTIGALWEEGPEVERARAIFDSLVPDYRDPRDYRVYVVENPEWNAIAAPNGAIYVFSGLLEGLDDDELALVLGHELAHATHEHSRKQYKKKMLVGLGALVAVAALDDVDNPGQRVAFQLAAVLMASAWTSGYGRSHEEQADRVGRRYAFDAGYDVRKGPGLWDRFAGRYPGGGGAWNFFFGSHQTAKERAASLRRELRESYRPE